MKKFWNYLEEIICVSCMVVMTVLTFANVIARKIFSASFSFSEEITTYLFVLLTFVGAAIAAKRGAHLGFTLLTDMVPKKAQKVLYIIGYVFAVLFCAALTYYGVLMVIGQFQRGQVTAGMQWPEWIFGSFIPIGGTFVTIRFIELLVKEIGRKPDETLIEEGSESK